MNTPPAPSEFTDYQDDDEALRRYYDRYEHLDWQDLDRKDEEE